MCIPANINLQMTDTGDHGGGVVGSTGGGGGVIASLWLFALIYEFFAPSRDPFPDTWNQGANAQALPQSQAKSIAIADEKVEEKRGHQEFFPEDPNLFVPFGLIRKDIPGSGNGKIIKWFVPGFKKMVIFEWDEDFKYGSHYHVMMPGDLGKHNELEHWKAGTPVPEPWNTIYFAYKGG